MQREIKLNKESTIYHYQLIRKLRIRTEMLVSYAVIALLFAAFQYIFYNNDGLLTWILGLVMIIVIHWAILRLTMLRVDEPEDRRWGWRFKLPWSGYLPVQLVEHQLFRKLHRHLLWLGLCAVAVIYPWASESLMISMISWHAWLLAPRLILLRQLRKARRDGVLRLDEQEVLFYHR
ncbi:transposase [Paenibacillus abyssi]|uniref:Uncharacterized protein n=1 Tax=Paenibacillus abyssi TaxID=1340531 RepID=A0A917LHR1_9BACL|nr:transposase [Paenibacillus abyssi]GGG24400.1 hypothetical protein GCM10010916_46130 [Paenibacillus abyssi]